jgi:hypothetical protein
VPSTRRSFVTKLTALSAVALAFISFGLVRKNAASASCSCDEYWIPDECTWQSYCGGLGSKIYIQWHTYDTLGSCDAYCYTEFWAYHCC